MANRTMKNRRYSFEGDVKDVFVRASIGTSGAVTLDAANSKGVKSITHDATGKYTVTFGSPAGLDPYVKLLAVNVVFDTSGAAGAAPAAPHVFVISDGSASATAATIQVGVGTPTLTDPASGEVMKLHFIFGDSTAS